MAKATPDLSAFEAHNRRGPDKCKVGRALEQLEPQDLINFQAAFEAPLNRVSHVAIVKEFKKRNLRVSENAIRQHRKGACCCA